MSNDRIRISFMEGYPMVNGNCPRVPNFHVSPGCPMPGMATEIIILLTTYLNLTIDVTKVGHMAPGWVNAFDEVYNNETDTYGLLFIERTPAFTTKFDFTKGINSVCCPYSCLIESIKKFSQ